MTDEKIVQAEGLLGDDDDARLVVGRAYPSSADKTENSGTVSVSQYMYQGAGAEPEENVLENRNAPRDKTDDWDWVQAKKRKAKAQYQRAEQLGNVGASGGLRLNAGKLRMDLTPPEWEWALADVTTQGSRKYEARNWEKGMDWSAMIGCAKRHLNKFLAGERYDGEEFDIDKGTTGCHHLAMAAWNLLALMSYDLREIGTNDMPKDVQLELFSRVNAATSDMGNDTHDHD